MYRLNFDGWPLYDPRGANKTDRLIIRDPDVQIGVNMAGSVKFTIDPGHPNADKVAKLHGTLELTDDAGVLFRGRVLDERQTFYNAVEYTAEGALAWLNDGIVEPYDFPADFQADPAYQAAAASGNVVAFFLGWLLDGYNAHALPERQIKLGTVTVSDPNNYITRADSNYPSTFEVISKKLAGSQLGGYLVMRYEADGNYLDYLSTFVHTNAQEITFGENLLDLVRECSAADLCTAVLPVGAEGLTLEGLPDGPQENGLVKAGKVLYNPQAEADYGRIIRKVEYSDITQAQNLLRTAAKDMGAEIRLPESLQVQACDLHYLDGTVPSFRLGLYTVIVSAPHDIVRKSYPLTELRPNILDPGATPITLNGTAAQLTARLRQAQQAEQERTDSAMRTVVKQASDMLQEILEQASGLYCTPEVQPDGSTIYYLHDKPTLAGSKNVIKLTADAIGFSTDGGHSYPYGFTVTGDMVARVLSANGVNAEWIKAGILQSVDGKTFYLDLEKGVLRMKATSLEIAGQSVGDIAADAASGALSDAKSYADGAAQDAAADALAAANKQAQAYNDALTQYEVARRLTNNFTNSGIYLQADPSAGAGVYRLYISADYIRAGVLDLNLLRLAGTKCGLKQGYGQTAGGRTTEGIVMYGNGVDTYSGVALAPYIIVTDAGIRLQTRGTSGSDYDLSLSGGNCTLNGNLYVQAAGTLEGNITYGDGTLSKSGLWIGKSLPSSIAINAYTDATSGVNIAGWSKLSNAAWVGNSGANRGLILHGNDIQADVSVRVTSDRDAKKDIEPLEATSAPPAGASDSPQEAPSIDGNPSTAPGLAAQYEAFLDALTPVRFHYKQQASTDPRHVGYIYQDALAALEAAGLDRSAMAALAEGMDEQGNVTRGIAYSELVALLHLKIKRQAAEMAAMAARITALEARYGGTP